jgi:glycosyltransferase involved in cell wall biosynthesis
VSAPLGDRPLVVVDADVLGRQRTGDETYVASLLRELGKLDTGLRIGAVTRFPALVPTGIEPIPLAARSQIARMATSLPLLLRRLQPDLAHFLYALPLRCPCPAVVTVGDLSFELEPRLLAGRDGLIFRTVVPRSVRKAARVIAVSERTRNDLLRAYGLPESKVAVVRHGVDPVFRPAGAAALDYVLFVGAIQERKNPLAALEAARRVGLPLLVAGPVKDGELAAKLARGGAQLLGYRTREELAELYTNAACLVLPSRFEGFGLPLLEAMACGTPVVCVDEPALREIAGEAAVFVPAERLAEGIERALADRGRLVEAGIERAGLFRWEETARRTLEVYRAALGLR